MVEKDSNISQMAEKDSNTSQTVELKAYSSKAIKYVYIKISNFFRHCHRRDVKMLFGMMVYIMS
jgi:hypothetical protein